MISIKNLVKDYGSTRAVDRINFSVRKGEIVGFLGPNGAGKSTTLKIITCYLSPTEGEINIDDLNIYDHPQQIRNMIGYLPENNPLYTDMVVYDYLKYIGQLRGLSEQEFNRNLPNALERCGLWGYIAKPIHTLSKGYRQRVGLAQAIIHDPEILILDEPTSGLDPNQILEIRELIKELGKEKTLILSTHILQEVQAVCNRIVIINDGKIVADGSMEELKSSIQGKTRLYVELIAEDFNPQAFTTAIPGVQIVSIKRGAGLPPKPERTAQTDMGLSLQNGKPDEAKGLPEDSLGRESLEMKTDIPLSESETVVEDEHENMYSMIIDYVSPKDLRKDIFAYIKKKDWILLEMHKEYISLEDLFRTLTIEKGVA